MSSISESISFTDKDGDKVEFNRYDDGLVVVHAIDKLDDTRVFVQLEVPQLRALSSFLREDSRIGADRADYIVRNGD